MAAGAAPKRRCEATASTGKSDAKGLQIHTFRNIVRRNHASDSHEARIVLYVSTIGPIRAGKRGGGGCYEILLCS